jgi:TonB family protein
MSAPKLLALLLLALAAAGARAEEPAAGALTRAPAVVTPAIPEYPADARARGVSGEVTLELDLSAEGVVVAARVVRPAGEGFDEAALAAAKALRFSPAEIDGVPAAVTLEYRFRFDAPPPPPPAQPSAVLRGVVVERGTRDPLGGVAVTSGEVSTFTDRAGRFELAGLPPGPAKVVAVDPAHERFETEERLEAGKALEVKYYLRRSPADLYEAVVVGERERKEVTSVTISASEVSRVAGVSGDTVKIVQNLPGVARAPGGFGMLVVRGGNPSDTRTYVDGVEVPLVFHFGGLTSIVPSELVDSVEFEAGNFGVRYGRATGGRVDLKTRDPVSKPLHVVGDGNLYHALALVEGAAGENVSVAFAARRSYADAMIEAAARRNPDAFGVSVAPRYYDYQGKLTWRASGDDAVRLTVLGSDDRMELTGVDTGGLRDLDRFRLGTAFVQAAATWEHRLGEGALARVALAHGFIDISNRFGTFAAERDQFQITSVRAEATQALGDRLALAAGVDTRFLPTSSLQLEYPAIPPPNQLPEPDPRKIRTLLRLQAMEAGLWAEATLKPVDGLVIVPGVRFEREVMINTMTWVDPRLSVRYAVVEGTTVKGAAGLYHQPPVPVYLTREWGNPALREEGAWHAMTGVEQRLFGPLTLDLQLYYKHLFDLVLPTDGPERYVNGGTGRAYGAEVLLRWNPGGRFFGWLAYSRSRSERDQKVVGGTVMPSGDAYDQPHNLVALGTVDLPEVWNGLSAGFRVRYATGNPYRRTVGAVYDADADRYQPVTDASSTARMPDFFQLDLRVDKRWTQRTWMLSLYLEVQNVTNRKNAEDVAYNYDYSQRGWMTGLPLFPSFGIRAEY